jgi:hypothetical protein
MRPLAIRLTGLVLAFASIMNAAPVVTAGYDI